MKKKLVAILLCASMLMTFMPMLSYAESDSESRAEKKKAVAERHFEKDNKKEKGSKILNSHKSGEVKSLSAGDFYFDCTYKGRPSLRTVDDIDDDGELIYKYFLEPNIGDSITVQTKEGQMTYVWKRDSDGDCYFELPDNPDDWLMVSSVEVEGEEEPNFFITREIWEEGSSEDEGDYVDDWGAIVYLDKYSIINTVSKIAFEPGTIYLVAENIISFDEGTPYYSFLQRSRHSKEGTTWMSPYALGDRLTVYYSNGITQTFTDQDLYFFYDDGDYYGYDWDDWFADSSGDKYIRAYVDGDELRLGTNNVKITWHGVSTNISVIVETAAQKAAREAEENRQARIRNTRTVTVNTGTVSAASLNNAIAAAGGSKEYVTTVVLGSKVKKINKNAFKGTNVTVLEVKSKKLKAKSVKGSLKGSAVKTVKVKAGSKYKKAYKKIFTKKNAGKKVSVK